MVGGLPRCGGPVGLSLAIAAALLTGCGGGGGGSSPAPVPVATAIPTPVPTATATPGPTPTAAPLPGVPFDLRGRVFLDGAPAAGVLVTATGAAGSTSGYDQTVTAATGQYSFLLGAGTYTLQASSGGRTAARTVTVPPGGQTVDNVDLTL